MFVSSLRAAFFAGLVVFAPCLARAGTHALPAASPVVSITAPDGWSVAREDLTIEIAPENEEIYVGFMLVSMGGFEKANRHWNDWLARVNIKLDASSKRVEKFMFDGQESISEQWRATDEDGPTGVMRTILKLSDSRLLFVTEWGAESAAKKYAKEIEAIRTSVTKLK